MLPRTHGQGPSPPRGETDQEIWVRLKRQELKSSTEFTWPRTGAAAGAKKLSLLHPPLMPKTDNSKEVVHAQKSDPWKSNRPRLPLLVCQVNSYSLCKAPPRSQPPRRTLSCPLDKTIPCRVLTDHCVTTSASARLCCLDLPCVTRSH